VAPDLLDRATPDERVGLQAVRGRALTNRSRESPGRYSRTGSGGVFR
jgi:hypothetical protein